MFTVTSLIIILAIFLWGILWRNSSVIYETLYRGDKSKKWVALTFDDGPDIHFTGRTLDILKRYNVKATFFCVGRLAEEHPDIVERIHKEGHLIANHTYEHSWRLFFWTPPRVKSSIEKAGTILKHIAGGFPRFYRPPVGIKTPPQALAAWRMGLKFVGWSRWALDGGRRTLTAEKTAKLISRAGNGDIFLLHDGKLNADGSLLRNEEHGKAIEEYLPMLIKGLQARGYELVTLDKMFGLSGYLETAQETLESGSGVDAGGLIKALCHAFLHEDSSPANISIALALGIVIGCSPFFGFHAPLALIIAYRFRLNKLSMLFGTNVSNPITGPFVILASIQTGWFVLNGAWLTFAGMEGMHSKSLWHLGNRFFESWLVGFPIVGAVIGIAAICICYPILRTRQTARSI